MQIRDAIDGDLGPVRELVAGAGLPVEDLAHAIAPGLWVVLEDGGRLVGVAGIEPCAEVGLLRSVVVAGDARGRGHGRTLVEAAAGRAAARGIDPLYLLTIDRADFFAHLGFAELARDAAPAAIRATSEFGSLCPASAVLMTRSAAPG